MTFWLGLFIIVVVFGGIVACVGVFTNRDAVAFTGAGFMFVPLVLLLLGFGVALMLGIPTDPVPVVGSCYKAVEHNGYVPVSTGKTTVIIPYHGVDLVEVMCS
jgi:hypothetical protein